MGVVFLKMFGLALLRCRTKVLLDTEKCIDSHSPHHWLRFSVLFMLGENDSSGSARCCSVQFSSALFSSPSLQFKYANEPPSAGTCPKHCLWEDKWEAESFHGHPHLSFALACGQHFQFETRAMFHFESASGRKSPAACKLNWLCCCLNCCMNSEREAERWQFSFSVGKGGGGES